METYITEAASGGPVMSMRARLRAKLDRRDQQGSMLLEAVVVMFIITLTVAGFVGVQTAVAKSADQQQVQTAIDQHLNGIVEETMSIPWASVVACRASLLPYTPGSDTLPPVQVLNSACPTPGIPADRTVEIDGRTVSITTDVNWVLPSATAPVPVNAAAYGLKQVRVNAQWTNPGATVQSQARVVVERAPTLDEVAPR